MHKRGKHLETLGPQYTSSHASDCPHVTRDICKCLCGTKKAKSMSTTLCGSYTVNGGNQPGRKI